MTAPSQLGRYRLLGVLGKAAMGTLYRGHDDVFDRDVVIKVLTADEASDPAIRLRFEREAKVTASLAHPNIIGVLDCGSDGDTLYITFEALEGNTLRHALDTGISLSASVPAIVQVLDGLAHAHEHGVVHRDIKPDNIFIRTDGLVKIMNFELARLTTASPSVGSIVGPAEYMAPEQVMGKLVDPRSDLFSVGSTLYECVTGYRPFHADNLMSIFYRVTHVDPHMEWIPQEEPWTGLRRVIARALQRRTDERYQDACAMSMDLRSALNDLGDGAGRMTRAHTTGHRPSIIVNLPRQDGYLGGGDREDIAGGGSGEEDQQEGEGSKQQKAQPAGHQVVLYDPGDKEHRLVVSWTTWRATLELLHRHHVIETSELNRLVWRLGGPGTSIPESEAGAIAEYLGTRLVPGEDVPVDGDIKFDAVVSDGPLTIRDRAFYDRLRQGPRSVRLESEWLDRLALFCRTSGAIGAIEEGVEK